MRPAAITLRNDMPTDPHRWVRHRIGSPCFRQLKPSSCAGSYARTQTVKQTREGIHLTKKVVLNVNNVFDPKWIFNFILLVPAETRCLIWMLYYPRQNDLTCIPICDLPPHANPHTFFMVGTLCPLIPLCWNNYKAFSLFLKKRKKIVTVLAVQYTFILHYSFPVISFIGAEGRLLCTDKRSGA